MNKIANLLISGFERYIKESMNLLSVEEDKLLEKYSKYAEDLVNKGIINEHIDAYKTGLRDGSNLENNMWWFNEQEREYYMDISYLNLGNGWYLAGSSTPISKKVDGRVYNDPS
jgi:hypothetical protein